MLQSGAVIKPVRTGSRDWRQTRSGCVHSPVRGYSDSGRHLMSALFNSSTAICWYNLDAFARAGLQTDTFPATWPELVALARTIRDKQAAKYPVITSSVVWAHFEQFSAIHNLPYATAANGFDGLDAELRINSPPHVPAICNACWTWRRTQRSTIPAATDRRWRVPVGRCSHHLLLSALRGSLASSAKFRWAPAFLPPTRR